MEPHQIDYERLVGEDRVHGSLYADPDVFADEMERISPGAGSSSATRRRSPNRVTAVTRTRRPRVGDHGPRPGRCRQGHGEPLRPSGHGAVHGAQWALHLVPVHLPRLDLRARRRAAAVPYPGGFDKDKADLGLDVAGQVDSHRGFVFADLDGGAGPLSSHLGEGGAGLIDRLSDLSPTGSVSLSAGWIGHRVQSNWKMSARDDNDGYHLNWVHASMVAASPDTHYQETVLGGETGNRSAAADWGGGHVELDLRPSYGAELAWLGTTRDKVAGWCESLEAVHGPARAAQMLHDGPPHALVFPNLFLGEMNIAIIEPVAPGEMVHWHTPVQLDGVDEAFNRRLRRQSEAALGPAAFIVPDDAVVAERMRLAMTAARPDWSDRSRAWIDMSRGLARERRARAAGWRRSSPTRRPTGASRASTAP